MKENTKRGNLKTVLIAGGVGLVVGYFKCLRDVSDKYGNDMPEGWVNVDPVKGLSIGVRNRNYGKGES